MRISHATLGTRSSPTTTERIVERLPRTLPVACVNDAYHERSAIVRIEGARRSNPLSSTKS
jgi:hypothetical protein